MNILSDIEGTMTPERIKLFLRCFYEQYIESSYQGYEVDKENEDLMDHLGKYDVRGYFLTNLDVYIGFCDYMKEYKLLYNPSLFDISKEKKAEEFNELEIFLIENFQLFMHTILEAAINKHFLKETKVKSLKLYMKPIDNKSLKLLNLIDEAEKKMKSMKVSPPAMG